MYLCELFYEIEMFQSTRPRGARLAATITPTLISVSIHAPARGATLDCLYYFTFPSFNPRARAGRDFSFVYLLSQF